MKPTGATKDWEVNPLPIHGYQIVDVDGEEIVRDVYRREYAEQISSEHNAVKFAVECGANWNLEDWRNWLRFHAQPATPSTSAVEGGQIDS